MESYITVILVNAAYFIGLATGFIVFRNGK